MFLRLSKQQVTNFLGRGLEDGNIKSCGLLGPISFLVLDNLILIGEFQRVRKLPYSVERGKYHH